MLPTAHDMAREFRVISALVPTDVPVPETVALCTDQDVLGATFYLMSFVDGVVLDRPEAIAELTPQTAARTCEQLVDTLVRLHAVDPDAGRARRLRPPGRVPRPAGAALEAAVGREPDAGARRRRGNCSTG